MNNDMLPVGETVNIKPGDIKWNGGDLISREALKEEVRKHTEYYADRTSEDRYNVGYTECACEILDFIDNAPPVEEISVIEFKEPLPMVKAQKIVKALSKMPKGEWIDDSPTSWKCSCCGYGVNRWNNTPFCPNCGIKMQYTEKEQ